MVTSFKIIWTEQAESDLKEIYKYYSVKSTIGAQNVINDILEAPKKIHFSKQYQIDEINDKYRRIVVRDFKLLYIEKNEIIYIIGIVSTKQSQTSIKKK